MCRPRGGIECDLTITRVEPERFYVVSAAATELHDYAWIESHLPEDGSEQVHDVTSRSACFGIMNV